MRRILPISPGRGALEGWLEAVGAPALLREDVPVAHLAAGHIVHLRCPDAPVPGCGLHLPGGEDVATWRAHDGILGVSTHSVEEALQAERSGADYVVLSPVFTPTSKPDDTRPTLGIEGLRRAQEALSIPVYALGGVTPENAAEVLAVCHGVAVLGALADRPERIGDFPC